MARSYVFGLLFLVGIVCALFVFTNFRLAGLAIEFFLDKDAIAAHMSNSDACDIVPAWKPDILFVGDSHTGSGWHHYEVSVNSKYKVGTCWFSGANISSIAYAVDKLLDFYPDQSDQKPIMVVGLAPRQFWVGENSQKRIDVTKDKISDLQDVVDVWGSVLPHITFFQRFTSESNTRALAQLQPYLQWARTVSEPSLESLVKRSSQPNFIKWIERLEVTETLPDYKQAAEKLCHIQAVGKAQVLAVLIPESPILQKMYLPHHLQPLKDAMSYLEGCGIPVVNKSNEFHAKNTHFVQTYDVSELDRALASESPMPGNWFNADHMSFSGAVEFTKWFINQPAVSPLFGGKL